MARSDPPYDEWPTWMRVASIRLSGLRVITRPDADHESADLDPRNAYAATKLHGEHLGSVWSRETASGSPRCASTTSTDPACPGIPLTRA